MACHKDCLCQLPPGERERRYPTPARDALRVEATIEIPWRVSMEQVLSLEDEAVNGSGEWSLTTDDITDLVLDLADARRALRERRSP